MNYITFVCLICMASASTAMVLTSKHSKVLAVNQQGDLVLTDEVSSVPNNCDFGCTDQDVPVCGNNGQCLQKFSSSCTMAAYNCRHPQKRFDVVENYRCEESWAPTCNVADRRELNL